MGIRPIKISYTTTTKKTYPIYIYFKILPSRQVPVDKEKTDKACKLGCNLYGRNGGCPPFSPKFNMIAGNETLVLFAKLSTDYYPTKVLNGPYYTRWVFIETFLTSLTNKIGIELAANLKGYFLSSGNCHGCRPKRCAVKDGKPCRNNKLRTFSLESTGVLVTELIKDNFGFELQWWKKGETEYIPDYMIKCIGITSREGFIKSFINAAVLKALNSERIVIL